MADSYIGGLKVKRAERDASCKDPAEVFPRGSRKDFPDFTTQFRSDEAEILPSAIGARMLPMKGI